MPIYEYQCEKCHHKMEALRKISDEPLRDCPACSEPALRKLVSASAFRLKGSGWYETDFKSGDKKNLAGGDDKPAAASKGDSSSDSATKPAAADTAKPAAKAATSSDS